MSASVSGRSVAIPISTQRRHGDVPIVLLGSAVFLSALATRVIDPLLPIMASDFHKSVGRLSILIAAFSLCYGANQLLLGPAGERFGRLRVMLVALVCYALTMAACAAAPKLSILIVLRALCGAASGGLIPVALAYIGDCVPYEDRQVTIGQISTGIVIGQITAGPLGGVLGGLFGWRGVFAILSVLGLTVATALALRLRDLPDRRATGVFFSAAAMKPLFASPYLRGFMIATLADGILLTGCFPFIAPYLHDGLGFSFSEVGLVVAAFGLGALCYTRASAFWLRNFGEAGLVRLGGAAMAGALAFGMMAQQGAVFAAVEVLLGLGYFMLHSVLMARATEFLPGARGVAVSGFVVVLFLGQAIGASAMGLAVSRLGYQPGFWIDALCILVLAAWLSRLVALRSTDQHDAGGGVALAKRGSHPA